MRLSRSRLEAERRRDFPSTDGLSVMGLINMDAERRAQAIGEASPEVRSRLVTLGIGGASNSTRHIRTVAEELMSEPQSPARDPRWWALDRAISELESLVKVLKELERAQALEDTRKRGRHAR